MMGITATDFFCGAGGSSEGMKNAGVEIKMAVNHWQLAIETHNTNHPATDHDCVDIRTIHPSQYVYTDIFWASPECTNHSLAKGKVRKNVNQVDLWGNTKVDPAEERSRATMREVVEFAAYHHNPIVIVENVVDIRYWQHYEDWLRDMMNLGYEYKTLYLNAMFFGVPQSRDRWYTVFWLKGNKVPNLDFRPRAVCAKCGEVEAVQSFKKDFQWGRYGANRQYVYRCPKCAAEVKPPTSPAAMVINWNLPAQRIGDREKPLKPKTEERIKAGLRKFSKQAIVANLNHTQAQHESMVTSVHDPLATQTTRQSFATIIPPFIATYHHKWHAVSDLDDPLRCITTFNNEHLLVVPPFFLNYNNARMEAQAMEDCLPTIATRNTPPVVIPPYMVILKNSAPDGYLMPSRGIDEPLTTVVASASQHGLVIPPFVASLNHSDIRNTPTDDPMPTVMPDAHPSLVMPPFMVYLRNECPAQPIEAPLLSVVAGGGHHGLVEPEALYEDCRFRMLEPGELKLAMSFPDSYVILGNKRDQTRQVGNAVACKVAEWIVRQCVESLVA